ncbi:hypothetical protein HYR69_07755 [Candidatus Sumerlaeota bacterium]|nr:hypothetical protein [Candidatus Sumerlaeota bacterium]
MPAPMEDRRQLSRTRVNLQTQVQILFPEATFTPVVLNGLILDLSLEGTRINAFNLSTSDYSKIIRGPRLCRMICTFPADQTPTRLFGKILNFEIHGKVAEGCCLLGINFGENEEKDIARLKEFLSVGFQGSIHS